MSVARITSGVFAGFERSTGGALPNRRNAPPVPVALSWQPAAAQVFVEMAPPWLICNCARKIGWMHFWK